MRGKREGTKRRWRIKKRKGLTKTILFIRRRGKRTRKHERKAKEGMKRERVNKKEKKLPEKSEKRMKRNLRKKSE
jgi:hypothetical protein